LQHTTTGASEAARGASARRSGHARVGRLLRDAAGPDALGRSLFADPRLWRSLALGAVTTGLVAALAVGLGALTRGAGLPVVLLALWAGVLEPLVAAVLGGGAVALLPFLSMLQLAAYSGDALGVGAPGPLSAAVCPLCLAATLAAAAVVLARRDATLS
jgi:hypothetical protein